MDVTTNIKEAFEKTEQAGGNLAEFGKENWKTFSGLGLPALKHEEWRYTKIKNLFNGEMLIDTDGSSVDKQIINNYALPGVASANSIIFVNGRFRKDLSSIVTATDTLVVKSLEEASGDEDADFVSNNLGHSQKYHADGINALNGAFAAGGVYINIKKGKSVDQPIVIYSISDSSNGFRLSLPRILVNVEEAAQVEIVQTYINHGGGQSLTNEVIEMCVGRDAILHYVKLQHEGPKASHTGTTHIRQLGKAFVHAVTITLDGEIVRNNLNMIMEAEYCESNMYGLYLIKGNTLADNHTIVDNVVPNCLSNELYKGIMDESATGVFNGKIFVRQDAQKTNAYQSNKNILLGDKSSANTKPQLEIFADDVKCSHGCTIGKLDKDAMFYLKARGISEANAQALLLHAFAADILNQIKNKEIKAYVESLISERLSFSI
ncbi:MAG: Fe-S cluster assembly protein SufD [bacterium]|jgi:Fe-S cluster assembly protein SufD